MAAARGHQEGSQTGRAYKLTPAFVRRVVSEQPPTRETHYADQDVPRHYLRVRPPSRPGKPWPAECRVRYTLSGGRRVWLTTGNPRTMDLLALRAAARAALAIADAGRNPAAERDARAAAWTVRQLWQAYRASPEFTRHTPKVQDGIVAAFSLHIVPRFGNERLADIDIPMVRRLMRAIAADNRTNARRRKLGGPGAARKVVRLFSSTLTWAVGEGQLSRNPIIGSLRLDGDGARETVITEPAQYAAFFQAMDRMVAAGELRPAVRAFLVCSALTGMRRGELQGLSWGQVDLSQRRITLTTSKGAKLARRGVRTETISVPPLAAAALAEIRPKDAADDERVFLPRQGAVLEVNREWRRVRAAAGLPDALTLHGLRHSIGTTAVLSGLSAPEVQALLRHRNIGTSSKYIHLAEATRSRLQDRATAHLVPESGPAAEATKMPARRAEGL